MKAVNYYRCRLHLFVYRDNMYIIPKRKRYNSGSGDGNYDKADPAYKARKKRALDYLGNRWQRENNYSDDSVDRICNYAYGDNDPHFEDSDLTSNQLRRLGKQPKQDFGKLAYYQQKRK